MSLRTFAIKPLALAALLGLAGAANASFVTYDSTSAFAAATSTLSVGTDTFSTVGVGALGTTLNSSAGTTTYSAIDTDDQLYGLGGVLSTNSNGDRITFSNFSKTVYAIGANFFNTTLSGTFAAGEALTLTVVDASGSHDFLYSNITGTNSFFGIVSTVGITSLVMTGYTGNAYATVDNLELAAAVPEPETYALMLGGLGVVAWLRRRQAKSAA